MTEGCIVLYQCHICIMYLIYLKISLTSPCPGPLSFRDDWMSAEVSGALYHLHPSNSATYTGAVRILTLEMLRDPVGHLKKKGVRSAKTNSKSLIASHAVVSTVPVDGLAP